MNMTHVIVITVTAMLTLPFGLINSADAQRRSPNQPARRASGGGGGGGGEPAPAQPGPGDPRGAEYPVDVRTIDGSGNNMQNPEWGQAGVTLLRIAPAAYEDGTDSPAGPGRRSAREISNACAAQDETVENSAGATDFLWQWGQFLDHDIDLSPTIDPPEAFDIPVPAGDVYFDPYGTGTQVIPLDRSYYEYVGGVREQVNEITAYIDASNVYGSDETRAAALRTLDGTGRLKTSDGDLLPYNTDGLPNAPTSDAAFFLAGDFRANEQAGLTAMHTLFVREHNYWAAHFASAMPGLSGDELYEMARGIVAAEMQAITYREFLPVLIGRDALRPYRGYRPGVNAGIANEFSTGAYRLGHSMLSATLLRLDAEGSEIAEGHIALRDAFFNPAVIEDIGIDPYMRGLAAQVAQDIDNFVIDDVRNFLFGPPGSGGFDLASLNIQRGRDHGLADYNTVRTHLGLEAVEAFAGMSSDPQVQANLADVYDSVDDMDLWVAGLAEDKVPGALVDETYRAILADQFERLRDGDRFWYERYMSRFFVDLVNTQTLARIIRRNTGVGAEIQDNVFVLRADGPPEGPRPPRDGRRR